MTAITTPLDQRSLARKFVAGSLLPIVTALLAVLIILAVFAMGVRRGMDGVIAVGKSEQTAWAVAISEMVYGLDGYVAHAAVIDTIIQRIRGGTSGPGDPNFEKNIANPDLLNAAISAALSLGPQPEGFVSERSLRTMVDDDIGIVDYDKIAFALFGFRVQSLYYLFFVILSLSTSVFLLQYWRRPMAQVLLLCNLVAFWLELHTAMFTPHMPSLWGMRHGSTLAILPTWHVALLMAYRTRLSWSAAMLGLIQIAIIVFAIRICGSAGWTVIFLAALAAFFAFQLWRNTQPGERSLGTIAKAALKWPFVLLLIGLAANKLYTDAKLHPAYFTDDIMPYHGAWHSAYLGIIVSPTLVAATGDPKRPWGDAVGYAAALQYLRKKSFIATEGEYFSPWTHTYKMRLHDRTMKSLYLDLVSEYPFTTVALYVYWKPLHLRHVVEYLLAGVPPETWVIAVVAFLLLGVTAALMNRLNRTDVLVTMALALAAVLFASIPSIWAYASVDTVADAVLSFLVLAFVVAWAVGVWLVNMLRSRS
ncbi:MAG: hypothetical protein ISP49_00680 [Reyranella sp.]|nr:hypothetical protein [Reyranella sp.]MBL6650076.1 hypothetical protein [Reyranella sp.]